MDGPEANGEDRQGPGVGGPAGAAYDAGQAAGDPDAFDFGEPPDPPADQAVAALRIEEALAAGADTLSLAGLGLREVPAQAAALRALRYLDLSDNRLIELPAPLRAMSALRSLDLTGNALAELPAWIGALGALERLLLRGNELMRLAPEVCTLARLTQLDLADNRLVELPPALAILPRLGRLDVSGNPHLILPPQEVVAAGGGAVLAYLRGLPEVPGAADETQPIQRIGRQFAVEHVAHRVAPSRAGLAALVGGVLVLGAAAWLTTSYVGGPSMVTGAASVGGMSPVPLIGTGPAASQAAAAKAAASATRQAAQSGAPDAAGPPSPSASPSAGVGTGTAGATPTANAPFGVAGTGSPSPSASVPVAPPTVNLAQGAPAAASSTTQNYPATNIDDGNPNSYWESATGFNVFPQTVTVDLGSVTTVGRIVLDLPPSGSWYPRTQTITVLGSTDDTDFATLVPSAQYSFTMHKGDENSVSIILAPVHARYIQLSFEGNTGWPAAQLSELGVFS